MIEHLSELWRLALSLPEEYGWERLLIWIAIGIVYARASKRPLVATGRFAWNVVSWPFRSGPIKPDSDLLVALITSLRSTDVVWSRDTNELVTDQVLFQIGLINDEHYVRAAIVDGQDCYPLLDSEEAVRLRQEARAAIDGWEERRREAFRQHALQSLRAVGIQLVRCDEAKSTKGETCSSKHSEKSCLA